MKIFQIDSFTKKRFHGNPAAVCLVDHEISEIMMQKIASEMNLSETAFIKRKRENFELRWFTPKSEVSLCGHATLAAAHVLWEQNIVPKTQVVNFETKSGVLKSVIQEHGLITIDLPVIFAAQVPVPDELKSAFKGEIINCLKSHKNYLLEFSEDKMIWNADPNLDFIKKLVEQGVVITAKSSDGKYDFVSRYFAPRIGLDEDPVTGSAHCMLAPYWSDKLDKLSFNAYQASERGGDIKVRLEGDRVFLSGNAITVFNGELLTG